MKLVPEIIAAQIPLDGILLYYNGNFSQALINQIGHLLQSGIPDLSEKRIAKRILAIFVEQAQNILRYAAVKGERAKKGIFLLGRQTETEYFLVAGNPVTRIQKEELETRLTVIRQMSREEILNLYKSRINRKNTSLDSRTGAGLLDIAKNADLPLDFFFQSVNTELFFYYIKTVLVDN